MSIELQPNHEERIKIFKALADPTRLEIIRTLYLNRGTERNCTEIGEHCDITKSNASYHFRTLREAGLIKVRKDAQTKYMTLDLETFMRVLPGFLETL